MRRHPKITPNQSLSASLGTSLTVTLTVELVLLPRTVARASDYLERPRPYLAAALASLPEVEVITAWRSRALVSSAWILARSLGSIVASSRSGGRSLTGR